VFSFARVARLFACVGDDLLCFVLKDKNLRGAS